MNQRKPLRALCCSDATFCKVDQVKTRLGVWGKQAGNLRWRRVLGRKTRSKSYSSTGEAWGIRSECSLLKVGVVSTALVSRTPWCLESYGSTSSRREHSSSSGNHAQSTQEFVHLLPTVTHTMAVCIDSMSDVNRSQTALCLVAHLRASRDAECALVPMPSSRGCSAVPFSAYAGLTSWEERAREGGARVR